MTSRSLAHFPDILYIVFSSFDADFYPSDPDSTSSYEARRALAIAARTCRGFTDPALKALWKQLPDDQPLADLLCELGIATREVNEEESRDISGYGKSLLVNLGPRRYQFPSFPEDSEEDHFFEAYEHEWKQMRRYDIGYRLSVQGDPRTHPGWPRFVVYASRVRAITLFAFDGPKWCGLWTDLRTAIDGTDILPMLQKVSFCSISEKGITPGGFPLISSSVGQLDYPLWNSNIRHIFKDAFLAAPNIKKLRLASPYLLDLDTNTVRTHLSHITHLEIHPELSNTADLQLLIGLPALQFLSMSYLDILPPDTNMKVTLRCLTTLAIEGPWTFLDALFHIFRLPSIHTLNLTAYEYGKPAAELAADAARCFGTISSQYPPILKLTVATDFGPPPPSEGCVDEDTPIVVDSFDGQLVDIIRPLFSLHAIRHLSVMFPDYLRLSCTSSDHMLMAEAWPELEALHLDLLPFVIERGSRPYGGPIHGIMHYARSCQRLRTLHLPAMQLTEEAFVEVDHDGARDQHCLHSLTISKVMCPPGRADDGAAKRILKLVGGVFPLAASAFRPERTIKKDDWVLISDVSRCLGCVQKPQLTPSQRESIARSCYYPA